MAKSANLWLFKMRRLVFITIGGVLCTSQQTHAKFDGFYVGSSVGYLQQNTSINAKQNPANPNAHVNNTDAQKGLPTVEIFLGWGKVFGSCFYGGLEGKIDWALGGNSKVAEDTNFEYHLRRSGFAFATLARLGYLVTPNSMIYVGMGAKLAHFEHNLLEKVEKISALYSKKTLHLFSEVGMEFSPSSVNGMALRVSYSFMPKRCLSPKVSSFPANHIYRDTGVLKMKAGEHAVKMGLVYRF